MHLKKQALRRLREIKDTCPTKYLLAPAAFSVPAFQVLASIFFDLRAMVILPSDEDVVFSPKEAV